MRDCTICLNPGNPSKHKQIRTIPLSTTSHSDHFQSHQPAVPAANVQVCTKRPRDVSSKRTERSSRRTWRWNSQAGLIDKDNQSYCATCCCFKRWAFLSSCDLESLHVERFSGGMFGLKLRFNDGGLSKIPLWKDFCLERSTQLQSLESWHLRS